MSEKKEIAECFKKTYITPQGEASYPHLAEPQTKFNEDGIFDVTMYFDEASGGEFVASLEKAYNKACEEAKAKYDEQKAQYKKDNPNINYEQFYKEEVDDNGFSTGRIFVKFKKKAQFKTKENKIIKREVAVFDRHNSPLEKKEIEKAGSGSIMKCAFKVSPYFVPAGAKAGISLQLEAVQIVNAKEWNGKRTASEYGFQSFEDEDEAAFAESRGADDF